MSQPAQPAVRSQRLLLSLGTALLSIRQADSEDEVFGILARTLQATGYQAVLFRLQPEGARLELVELTSGPQLVLMVEKLAGVRARGLTLELGQVPLLQRVVRDGEVVYCDDMAGCLGHAIPSAVQGAAGKFAQLLGMGQGVYAPLRSRGRSFGLVLAAGSDLSEAEVPALASFATQVGVAVENARLLAELSAARAGLEQQVRERIAALAESEARYRGLFEHAEVGMFRSRLDGSAVLAANRKLAEILDSTVEEILAEPAFLRWADPADRDVMLAELHERGRVVDYEVDNLTMKGEQRCSLVSIQLFPEQGELEGSVVDITERKRTEAALGAGEERFRTFFDSAPIGKSMTSPQGLLLRANPALCDMLGYTAETLAVTSFAQITHPDDLPESSECVRCLLAGERDTWAMEKRYLTANGRYLWTHVTTRLVRDEAGEPLYFLTHIQDIDQHKRDLREFALRNQIAEIFLTTDDQGMYPAVLDAIRVALDSPRGVFGYLDGLESLASPSLVLEAWDYCEMVGEKWVLPHESWGESSWVRCLRACQPLMSNEQSDLTPLGHITIDRHVSMPIVHRGQAIGLIQVANRASDYRHEDLVLLERVAQAIAPVLHARLMRDRQEQQRLEAQVSLQRAVVALESSNSDLEQFAYVASHDLQEPLRMVSSYLQLLQRRYQGRLDADADVFIGYAVDGARRMKALINDLLTFSRVGTHGAAFEIVSMERVLQRVRDNLGLLMAERGVHLEREALPEVRGDEGQLVQLLQNLIDNAIKFQPGPDPVVRVAAHSEGDEWVITVQDQGIGMEPQFLERIFTIFQRLHAVGQYPGTGIGLAVCKRIVERHGGRIGVESLPGVGSTFSFVIPSSEEPTP